MNSMVRNCYSILTTVSVDYGGVCGGAGITEVNHRISIPDDGRQ